MINQQVNVHSPENNMGDGGYKIMKRIILALSMVLLFPIYACSSDTNEQGIDVMADLDERESIHSEETETMETESKVNIEIIIQNETFSAMLYDNETAKAFFDLLPMTLTMSELNGNEKYSSIENRLPTNAYNPSNIRAGDLMLYGSNCLVLFYDSFPTSYSYTPLGKIDDFNNNNMVGLLGNGDIEVTFSCK
jgi:hypothetical protein